MDVLDISNLKVLKDGEVLAGKNGLSNVVLNATLIDAPDGYKWCREGDFILSTGFPFTENQDWKEGVMNLIEILIEKKCAGLGIKLGRYVPYLTESIISFANKNNLPILSIPHKVKWTDIIVPIVTNINEINRYKLEMNQKVYNKYHNYLKNRGDLNELINILQGIIDSPITIYIRGLNKKIDSNTTFRREEDIEHIISTFSYGRNQTMEQLNMNNQSFTVRWISNSDTNRLEGGIFLWNHTSQLQTWEKIALEQTAVITALEIERIRKITATYQRFRNDFLSKLLSDKHIPQTMIMRRAKEVNWRLGKHNRVLLLDCDFKKQNNKPIWRKKANILEEFESALQRNFYKHTPLGFDEKSRFLFLLSEEIDLNAFIHFMNKTIARLNITNFYGGIGQLKDVNNLNLGYKQAETALNVAYSKASVDTTLNQRNSLFIQKFEELHVERILFSKDPMKEARLFANYLKKVIDYDKNRNGELILTLKAFLTNNANFDDTAQDLYIHKNTVRYRINMINDLTNLDPRKIEDQLILHMALTALNTQPIS